jgi:hypothetical protein
VPALPQFAPWHELRNGGESQMCTAVRGIENIVTAAGRAGFGIRYRQRTRCALRRWSSSRRIPRCPTQ